MSDKKSLPRAHTALYLYTIQETIWKWGNRVVRGEGTLDCVMMEQIPELSLDDVP